MCLVIMWVLGGSAVLAFFFRGRAGAMATVLGPVSEGGQWVRVASIVRQP